MTTNLATAFVPRAPRPRGRGREGREAGDHTAETSQIAPHAASQLRLPPAGAWDPDQLPQPVAGTLVDPDYIDLS